MHRWFLLLLLVTSAPAETMEICTEGISPEVPLFKNADMPAVVQAVRQHCRGRRFPDFISRDGREFRDVRALAADDRGVMVRYHLGTGRIPYEQLSGELQKEFIGRAFPKMSPEVGRRQAIYETLRTVRKLEEFTALLKTNQERAAGAFEKRLQELEAMRARDHAKIVADLERLDAERQQLENELADFNEPGAVAARRVEMEKQRVEMETSGRPVVQADPAKLEERRKRKINELLLRTKRKIDLATKSLSTPGEQAETTKTQLVKAYQEVAGPGSSSASQIELFDKRLAEARQNLVRLAEESARQGDDPAAFDRYCEENQYPRR